MNIKAFLTGLMLLGLVLSSCNDSEKVKVSFSGQSTSEPALQFQCSGEIVDDICVGASIACDGEVVDGVCLGTTIECQGDIVDGTCIGKTIQCNGEIVDDVCQGTTIVCEGTITSEGVCKGDTIECRGKIENGVCLPDFQCEGVLDGNVCKPGIQCDGVIVEEQGQKICRPMPEGCDEQAKEDEGSLCLELEDDFEREDLFNKDAPDNKFAWDQFIYDTSRSANNLNARIVGTDSPAPLTVNSVGNGQKAVLFTGRDGGSVHEIYLISRSFDLSKHDRVTIQFDWAHLQLERFVNLARGSETLQKRESIRMDVCVEEEDEDCGLNEGEVADLNNSMKWDSYYPIELPLEEGEEDRVFRGEGRDLANIASSDWKKASFNIDLENYPKRKGRFIFRIVATIDEGFRKNDPNRELEDGILLDHVIIAGSKASE